MIGGAIVGTMVMIGMVGTTNVGVAVAVGTSVAVGVGGLLRMEGTNQMPLAWATLPLLVMRRIN